MLTCHPETGHYISWSEFQVELIVSKNFQFLCSISGFELIGIHDQKVLLQYGQSASRLLVAAVHWYDEDTNDFGSFLSWREQLPQSRDKFKQAAIAVAKKIKLLNLNLTEEVLINALLVMSTGNYWHLDRPNCCFKAQAKK